MGVAVYGKPPIFENPMTGQVSTRPKAKVLLVQSAQTQGNGTRRYLEHTGYYVVWAGSGISALMAVRKQPVDLILLDFALPDIEGRDLCRRFRERPDTKDVPIILLTARGSAPEYFARPPEGPDDYLAKPYTEGELDTRIASVLKVRATARVSQPKQEPALALASVPRSRSDVRLDEIWGTEGTSDMQQTAPRQELRSELKESLQTEVNAIQPSASDVVNYSYSAPVQQTRSLPRTGSEATQSAATPVLDPPLREATREQHTTVFLPSAVREDEVIDPSTGLFSRRQFNAMFSKEYKRSVRFKQHMSCMLIDLDGRALERTADEVLIKAIFRLVQQTIREVDTAAWWSGEALIVLLPNTIRNDAVQAAMRVLEAVANHPFTWTDSTKVTMSIGVAGLPDRNIDSEHKMINAARSACKRAREWAQPTSRRPG
jgi:diguanylate cyclase (GGDEF)-like protein